MINNKYKNELVPGNRTGKYTTDNDTGMSGEPSLEEVDNLADELASEYSNFDFHTWYCKVIYKYGIKQVKRWRIRAAIGSDPGKLFNLR